jgi:hypothetical protein
MNERETEDLRKHIERLREHQFPLDRTYDAPSQLISEKRPEPSPNQR